jgi:hypothetical protein
MHWASGSISAPSDFCRDKAPDNWTKHPPHVGSTFLDTILEHVPMKFMVDDEKKTKKLLGLIKRWGRFPAA